MIRLHVDVIGLQRLPLAPAIRAEMVADVARTARQAVEKPLLGMFGTEKVNVLKLNIALEKADPSGKH